MSGPSSGVPVPYLPPTNPYALSPQRFEDIIAARGLQLYWLKSHACPCVYAGQTPGNPDPSCLTCKGLGTYWDNPYGPFTGLITFIHTSPTPDEPGARVDEDQGLFVNGEPALTIPYNSASGLTQTVWTNAKLFDAFIEYDARSVFNVNLRKGFQEAVPYQQSLSIAASGAVSVWDSTTHTVVTGVPYTVSGATVLLSSGYADGTNFTVEITAAPMYVAYRVAGMPAHVRPFSQLNFPRRFRLQNLDLWTRSRTAGQIPSV